MRRLLRALSDDVAEDIVSYDAAEDRAEHAQHGVPRGCRLALLGMVCCNMAHLVPKCESKLGLIVHQGHQLASDVNVAARDGESVFDRRIQRGEMISGRRIGNAGAHRDPASDGLDISAACAGLGASELGNQLRMLALRLGHVPRVQGAHGLCVQTRRQQGRGHRRGHQVPGTHGQFSSSISRRNVTH